MEINRGVFVLLMALLIAVPIGIVGLLVADMGRAGPEVTMGGARVPLAPQVGAAPSQAPPRPAPIIAAPLTATPHPTATPRPVRPTAVPTVIRPTATRPPPATATAVPQPSPDALSRVGQTVHGKNWSYVVTNVEKVKTLSWVESYGTPSKADAKGLWVVVYLTLKNTGRENFEINDHDFELRDGSGVKYTTSRQSDLYGFRRAKKLAALGEQFPPGVPANTAVVFDIAPDAVGLKLWLVQEKAAIDLSQQP